MPLFYPPFEFLEFTLLSYNRLMSESNISKLEQKRFVINPESMEGMKFLRETFLELQGDHPFLSGLGFFGSRTKGTEKPDSDYDVCIFYNSDRLEFGRGTKDEWGQIINRLESQLNIHLDRHVQDSSAGSRINISQERTDQAFDTFRWAVKPFLDRPADSFIQNVWFIPPVQDLYSRFFLTVGNEVYENRRYLFNRLKTDPKGEFYFQVLMGCLGHFERDNDGNHKVSTPNYPGYPQTIEDAEKYFLN